RLPLGIEVAFGNIPRRVYRLILVIVHNLVVSWNLFSCLVNSLSDILLGLVDGPGHCLLLLLQFLLLRATTTTAAAPAALCGSSPSSFFWLFFFIFSRSH